VTVPRALVIWTLSVLAVAGLIGGCGDAAGDQGAVRALVRAANVSSDYGSRFRVQGTINAEGQSIPLSGRAAVAPGGRRARFTSTFGSSEFEFITDGKFMLMSTDRLPGTGGLPPGVHWLRFDIDKVGQSIGLDSGPLRRLQNLDPGAAARISAGAGDVRELGTAIEHGVKVKRYESSSTLEEMTKALADGKDVAGKLPADIRDAKINVRTSIDDQDRIRSFRIRMGFSAIKMALTTTVTSFSQDITVDLPPSSEVFDATGAVAGQLGGLSKG
jgi:hypothetical protein